MKNSWRKDFPILNQEIYENSLIYLDNAATSQMPEQVLECIERHYREEHANIHRGIHYLSEKSTEAVERAREKIREFTGAGSSENIVFTQGTTDSIHLVSAGIETFLNAETGILVTELEHHSNFVPWQQICKKTGAGFYVCPAKDGAIDMESFCKILEEHSIFLAAVTHVSNLTGAVTPLEDLIRTAHEHGAQVLVDGAQGILHRKVDVTHLDCDYYVFSGHKMLGPTGIGVLYGKKERLEVLQPVRFGGGMVDVVSTDDTTWGPLPHRLEAGTPNISGAIGLGTAAEYIRQHDMEKMHEHERQLLTYVQERLDVMEHVHILGHPLERAGVLSFIAEDAHPYDMASMLDKAGIAVRSGHHCAQPALRSFGVDAAVRVSPAFYNTREEIDTFCMYLEKVIHMLRKWKRKYDEKHPGEKKN